MHNVFESLFVKTLFHKEKRMPSNKTFQRIGLLWKQDKENAKRYLKILQDEGLIREEREGKGRGKRFFIRM